jgi:hypothetical protein
MHKLKRKKDFPTNLPLRSEVREFVGGGQDNHVFGVEDPVAAGKYVVKLSHKHSPVEAARLAQNGADRKMTELGVRYKKNKYEILKHFLGDFVPESRFVLTQEGSADYKRYVEMTLQERVPQTTLADLSVEKRKDPALAHNMATLLGRLQYMYRVLGEVNARVGQGAQLDAKLDLGGVSEETRNQELDHVFSPPEIQELINSNKSPNLLVDPDTLQLYCIDFDQGRWTEGMDHSRDMAFAIDRRMRQEQAAPQLAALTIPPLNNPQRLAS